MPLVYQSHSIQEILRGKDRSITIKKCQESDVASEVSFADNLEKSVCGKAIQSSEEESSSENIMSDTSKDEFLNEALENLWNRGIEGGKVDNDKKGKAECQDSTKGWKIISGNQEAVKGYCESTSDSEDTSSKLSFLELSYVDGQKLRVCTNGNQCGTDNYDLQKVNTFSTKSRDEGYDLKFYKK